MTTLLLTHPASLDHATPPGHPERADRIRVIERALEDERFAMLVREAAPVADYDVIALAHSRDPKIDPLNKLVAIPMQYAGEDFSCIIGFNTIDDIRRDNFNSDDEYLKAVSHMLHRIIAVAERYASAQVKDGKFIISSDMIEDTP